MCWGEKRLSDEAHAAVAEPKPTNPKVKIVLVGDTAVGKSCLIINYSQQIFDDNYEPSVLDVYKGTASFLNDEIGLEIHDTTGDDLLSVNRQVIYTKTDCFMLCVSIANRDSFNNIEKWKAEIRSSVGANTPIILVGTKSDLRAHTAQAISKQELLTKYANDDFASQCETSSRAWQDHNVNRAFNMAISTAYYNKYPSQLK